MWSRWSKDSSLRPEKRWGLFYLIAAFLPILLHTSCRLSVCLSGHLSVMLCIIAKQYILQQKCLELVKPLHDLYQYLDLTGSCLERGTQWLLGLVLQAMELEKPFCARHQFLDSSGSCLEAGTLLQARPLLLTRNALCFQFDVPCNLRLRPLRCYTNVAILMLQCDRRTL